ncbi:MAG: DUF6550 family protein [Acetanaerobacterium sp.]
MKKKAAVIWMVPVLLIVAVALILAYGRSQTPEIVLDEPLVSSQPIEDTEPVDMPDAPPVTAVPVPEVAPPPQEDALTPETVMPDEDPPADTPPAENPPTASTPPADDGAPTGGEKQDGKIYLPGFGWIEDCGGGQGEIAEHAGTGEIIGY